jgi:AraC family transcriptional regulator, transcriptional activator of pobA
MKATIKNFGLYGRDESMVSADFVNLVSIDSSCRKHNWVIKPHFHGNLYQFFFIESGSGTFLFNEKSIHFSGINLLIIPENNLHGFKFSEDIKGYTLSVSSHIIDKIINSDKELLFQINRLRIINLNNNFEEFNDLMDSIRRMLKEFTLKAEKESQFLETLLLLLIIKMYRMTIETEKEFVPSSRKLSYFKEFIKMVKSEIPTNRNINDFTEAIGISKTHLNRVCQAIEGISTKEVISKYLINESMVLITHTDLTISEIAYQLEFKDVSYFCRFFKKQTGCSPAKYRSENQNIDNIPNLITLNY